MEEDQPVTTPKVKLVERRKILGLTIEQIIAIVSLAIGLMLFIIGVCILALCLFGNKTPSQAQPPPMPAPAQTKSKKKSKAAKEPEKPPVKKEATIEQEAAQMLVTEYQNTSIPTNIIIPSDTEAEQEVEEIDD